MPVLQVHPSRSKGVTPRKKKDPDDVWQRALDILGLEPLNSSSRTSAKSSVNHLNTSANTAAMAAPTPTPAPELAQGSKVKLTFLSLPLEAQRGVINHCSNTDLLALCLVSKHLRDIAAEQLYRKFEVTFPDDSDDGAYNGTDALAAGLETLVSSDYDYAKNLREVLLEPTNSGDKGERAYRYYMYDSSCGKFMNTLFLVALRKAKALEKFTWDIRVEISRPVFKALHDMRALHHLHLRMQAGHSVYQAPPTSSLLQYGEATPLVVIHSPPPPPGFGAAPHHIPAALSVTYPPSSANQFAQSQKNVAKMQLKAAKAVLPTIKSHSPTLSGFKHLKTLSVMDMDTLDYVGELRTCIRDCSSTLTSITLSFSEALANKSRKPPPEVHSDEDSEAEDEFGQLPPTGQPPPGMGASDPNGPTKVLKAQAEKKRQEDVLRRIFGLQTHKKSGPIALAKEDIETPSKKKEENPRLRVVGNFAHLLQAFMQQAKPGSDTTPEAVKALDMIKAALRIYVESMQKGKEKASQSSDTSEGTPTSSVNFADGLLDDNPVMSGGAKAEDEPGLFDNKSKNKVTDPDVVEPDDIDIEEPEGELSVEYDGPPTGTVQSQDSNEAEEEIGTPEPIEEEKPVDVVAEGSNAGQSKAPADDAGSDARSNLHDQIYTLVNTHSEIQQQGQNLKQRMEELQEKMKATETSQADFNALAEAEAQFRQVSTRVTELSRSMEALNELVEDVGADAQSQALLAGIVGDAEAKMSEYVRTTRGLALTNLAIFLIPVKASVLSGSIDTHILQSLTLLNVGPQVGVWNMLSKENKLSPLPLCKIYTDNVTMPFLQFVAELDKVTELLLLEKQKSRVESTAAKTTVKMEHIRRAVLKKHAPTLKVLMLNHDALHGSWWDMDVKTAMLLCHRATQLEELSVAFSVKTMHSFLQLMPGLISLRAVHVTNLRIQDQCATIMGTFRKFIVDSVAHNPQMKLEYIAMHDVDRLVRRTKPRDSKKDRKGKGKAQSSTKALAEMILGNDSFWPDGGAAGGPAEAIYDWQNSSDDDGAGLPDVDSSGLRIETIEGIPFMDIAGVRIFEKDVISGRL